MPARIVDAPTEALPELDVPGTLDPLDEVLYFQTAEGVARDGALCVEIGTWLGRSTNRICQGLATAGGNWKLHCVDRFRWTESYGELARKLELAPELRKLAVGDSFRATFEANVAAYDGNVEVYEGTLDGPGDVLDPVLADVPAVDALFVDASTGWTQNAELLRHFAPKLREGEDGSVLLFQNFFSVSAFKLIYLLMSLEALEPVCAGSAGGSMVFRLRKAMDPEDPILLSPAPPYRSAEEIYAIFERLPEAVPETRLDSLRPVLPLMLWHQGHKRAARSEWAKVDQSGESAGRMDTRLAEVGPGSADLPRDTRDVPDAGVKEGPREPERRELVVLGMHRSGTSCLTGALTLAGANAGAPEEMTPTSAQNPKGFFERKDLRALCDRTLHSIDADWWRVSALALSRVPHDVARGVVSRMHRVLEDLVADSPSVVKEPRLCLLLPLFRRAMVDPVVVHVYRNPLEVAYSLRTRNGFGVLEGLALWEVYNRSVIENTDGLPYVKVAYERLLEDPKATLHALVERLEEHGVRGLTVPDDEVVKDFISPSLRHEHADPGELSAFLTPSQRSLWELLRSKERPVASDLTPMDRASAEVLVDLETRVARLEEIALLKADLKAARKAMAERQAEEAQARRSSLESERLLQLEARFADELEQLRAELRRGRREARAGEADLVEQLKRDLAEQFKKDLAEQFKKDLAEQFKNNLAEQFKKNLVKQLNKDLGELNAAHQELAKSQGRNTRLIKELREELQGALAVREQLAEAQARGQRVEQELSHRYHELATLAEVIRRQEQSLGEARLELARRERELSLLAHYKQGLVSQKAHASLRLPFRSRWLRRQARILRNCALFDGSWYLDRYPDVREAGVDPVEHYLICGAGEGRDPGPSFSTRGYLRANPDIESEYANPLVHYVEHGAAEGRSGFEKNSADQERSSAKAARNSSE